jgi:hypothetical protein
MADVAVIVAVVAQAGQYVRCRDSIGDAVVELRQYRPPIVFQAFDNPAFPQWPISIEPPLHDLGCQAEQRGVVTRLWKRRPMHMMGEIETAIVHPFRRAEIEWMDTQHLGVSRNGRYSVSQG